jgi:hypothetical protein
MTRTTVVFALNLSIAVLGLTTNAVEHVNASSTSLRSVVSHRWDDLPEPPTETVWCSNQDAVYAACGTRPDELFSDLMH